ncbi:MAG TPA: GAF domain-containing sensor histidine kinase [Aggregatilineales bacterium]|nr:GAF domain-containing protein [Anaerolineales bacterium]HRE49475.1 GAF domain-containing sensor histidine kinase [Aggregatilineales bacterium]
MELAFTYVFVGGLCIGIVTLIIAGIRSRGRLKALFPWLMVVLVSALLAKMINILPPDAHLGQYASFFLGGLTQPALYVALASAQIAAFAALSIRYYGLRGALVPGITGVVWVVAIFGAALQTPGKFVLIGATGWLGKVFTPPNPLGLVVLGGWLILGLIILAGAFYTFATARLPEISNRALYWLTVAPMVIMGELLGISGSQFLREIGWLVSFIGLIGAFYGALLHGVFDVRRVIRVSITAALTTGLSAAAVFITLLLAQALDPAIPNRLLALVGLALAAALAYLPLRSLINGIMDRIFGASREDPTSAVRIYSQNIAGEVELPKVSDQAIDMVRGSLGARRGGLLLATRDDNNTIRLEPMESPNADMPEVRGWIGKDSPLYMAFFERRIPLRQYDLEYGSDYATMPPELLSFFKQLRMSAFAPIVGQGQVIGILAAGGKTNDDSYSPQDLELLATIAAQTGAALRNARLVNDLRKARDETQELNIDIIRTKERLEQLDKVKTDFITIASHELRTPLAQMRGYTDILEALNEQRHLDPDQTAGLTNNLRKATDRLEQLIADMLDVSQLGLEAMDLRFSPTTVDNVMRLAIEPLADSVNQRKLQLTAKGLKALPPIQADMQRLVQAFRNIVLNAIKYTPDGGRIDITAKTQTNERNNEEEIVIAIRDTGIGIEPKFQDLIFEKFFRIADPGLHSTGTTKFMGAGPGLGLTIARGMIEGHGGKIWVESPGHDPEKYPGTTFYIMLPVNPPENAKRVKGLEGGGVRPTSPMKPGMMPVGKR